MKFQCPDCQTFWDGYMPEATSLSRADVDYLHFTHRPMHPNLVGRNRRAEAKKIWAEWERLAPA